MNSFRLEFASNGYPFSDHSHTNVDAQTATEALKKGMADYKHPAGLYAAIALDAKGKIRARWLSSRAATAMDAPCGMLQWKGNQLFCSDKPVPTQPERWEEFPEPAPATT